MTCYVLVCTFNQTILHKKQTSCRRILVVGDAVDGIPGVGAHRHDGAVRYCTKVYKAT